MKFCPYLIFTLLQFGLLARDIDHCPDAFMARAGDSEVLERSITLLENRNIKYAARVEEIYRVLKAKGNVRGLDDWAREISTRQESSVRDFLMEAEVALERVEALGDQFIIQIGNDGKHLRPDGTAAKDFDIYIKDKQENILTKLEVKSPFRNLPHPSLNNQKAFFRLLDDGIKKGKEHLELGIKGNREIAMVVDRMQLSYSDGRDGIKNILEIMNNNGKKLYYTIDENGVFKNFLKEGDEFKINQHYPINNVFELIERKLKNTPDLFIEQDGFLPLQKIHIYTDDRKILKTFTVRDLMSYFYNPSHLFYSKSSNTLLILTSRPLV